MSEEYVEEPEDDFGLPSIQEMIDTGMAWRLEGSIGRQCMREIEDGYAILGEVGHHDYYGNYVPSRYEVEAGTKGSQEYADAMNEARD